MPKYEKYESKSAKETKQIAAELAKESKDRIFALSGGLGAGKTIFVQGFAQGLGIKEKIISPTFVLIRQHPLPHTKKTLYHIDLYRLEDIPNIKELGLEDLWSNPQNYVLIEWAEKITNFLPKDAVQINFEKDNQNRIITVS